MTDVVGVLALQGAFDSHIRACADLGVSAREVRTAAELAAVDRLILPGGESTTMSMMLERNEVLDPLRDAVQAGMPMFGTCAGMILLAAEVADGRADQHALAAIDLTVRRNGYGRQNQSFETDVMVEGIADPGEPLHAVFIRAPRVERVGDDVEVLAAVAGDPVICRSRSVLTTSFHPELSTDRRLHRYFLDLS